MTSSIGQRPVLLVLALVGTLLPVFSIGLALAGRWAIFARLALLSGSLLLLIVGLGLSAQSLQPFHHPLIGLAVVGWATGLWCAALGRGAKRDLVAGSVAVVLASGIALVGPGIAWPGTPLSGPWIRLAEMLYVLAVGALCSGLACAGNRGQVDTLRPAAVGISLVLQTASLVCAGIGAQRAWGAYWSWDPIECWRLAAWLVTAMLALVVRQLDWGGLVARLAFYLSAGFALLVLATSFALVRWIGLFSLYFPQ